QSSSADGGVGVTLDLDDLFVLDVDVLPTPHRTVGAHGLDHAVRILGARTQLFTPLGLGGVPTPRRVVPGDLSIHRPRLDPRTYPHACHLVPSGASRIRLLSPSVRERPATVTTRRRWRRHDPMPRSRRCFT